MVYLQHPIFLNKNKAVLNNKIEKNIAVEKYYSKRYLATQEYSAMSKLRVAKAASLKPAIDAHVLFTLTPKLT